MRARRAVESEQAWRGREAARLRAIERRGRVTRRAGLTLRASGRAGSRGLGCSESGGLVVRLRVRSADGKASDRTRLLGLRACGCAPRAEGTWLGEWFRVLSQAFDANRRVQRAACCADSTASCRFESARRVDPAHRGLRVAAASHCYSKTVASRRRLIRIVSCACRSPACAD